MYICGMKKKILVIVPHADDEVLGCGGYLLHNKDRAEILIVVGTVGGEDKRQDYKTRINELDLVCKELNATYMVLFPNHDAKLDIVPSYLITSKIDAIIDDFKPNEIFLSYKSRHQDHIKMYDCGMASFRLREGWLPELIALMEYPFISDSLEPVKGGRMYHDISDNMEEKLSLFNMYASQIRKKPSPLNDDGIRKFSAVRGMEIGVDYAEMFYVQKMKL